MKKVVMGTAGHIDHGKTALVKRLTGVDTDRLEEEKRRGMTIELGFAPLFLPSGNVISIIDVPGHEKFVKTMVAGVSGIDFVMLVIAADEGIMPQTREHIDILSLLNIRSGIVALTKIDLVDEEWLELVKDDIKKALEDTPLKELPVIEVSSVTGEGIAALVEELEELTVTAAIGNASELFRLPIDRVFTMTGHGTVITGTITGGKVNKGDVLQIMPSGLTARVRGIQVHNQSADSASAGERCALNISGVEKNDVDRGDIAAFPGIIEPTRIADAVLYTVENKGELLHNQRVHVHIGTKEALARLRVLAADKIEAGSKGYVQLRFEEPVSVLRGDRFIVRSYSPVDTLGGGRIIFHSAKNRQRYSHENIDALKIGEQGSLEELVICVLSSAGKVLSSNDIWREIFEDKKEIEDILIKNSSSGDVIWLKETNKYLSKELYNKFIQNITNEFMILRRKYPFRYQIDREEIKSKVFSLLDAKDYTAILNKLIEEKSFELDGKFIVQANKVDIKLISLMKETLQVEKAFYQDGLNIRKVDKLIQDLNIDAGSIEDIQKFLVKADKLIDIGNNSLIHIEIFTQTVNRIRDLINQQRNVTTAQVRDYLNIGRKLAIEILTFLDNCEVTQRIDDFRKPGVHFMDYYI